MSSDLPPEIMFSDDIVMNESDLTKDEAAVYDRQIRLWGMEAQNKLRNSTVLLVGLSSLGAEFAKNISLAGVKSVLLMDGCGVDSDDLKYNFIFDGNAASIGRNRADAARKRMLTLNPNVRLSVVQQSLDTMLDSMTAEEQLVWFQEFSIVVLADQGYDLVDRVDRICRDANVRFMCGSMFGWTGYAFFDFDQHEFMTKVTSPNDTVSYGVEDDDGFAMEKAPTVVEDDHFEKKAYDYASFCQSFYVDWSSMVRKSRRLVPPSYFLIKSMLRAQRDSVFTKEEEENIAKFTEIWQDEVKIGNQLVENQTVQPEKFDYLFGPPLVSAAAIVGGMMGQEAIKTLSEGKSPMKNIFIYSALDTSGYMCDFPPK